MAEIKGLDLGNLNPIYERGLTQLDVHQEKGRWNVSKDGAGRKGCQHKDPDWGEIHEPCALSDAHPQSSRRTGSFLTVAFGKPKSVPRRSTSIDMA